MVLTHLNYVSYIYITQIFYQQSLIGHKYICPYNLTNVLDFMSSKLSLYSFSILQKSCPLIILGYRTKPAFHCIIATKTNKITHPDITKWHGFIMKCVAWKITWRWSVHVYFQLVQTLTYRDRYNNLNVQSVMNERKNRISIDNQICPKINVYIYEIKHRT